MSPPISGDAVGGVDRGDYVLMISLSLLCQYCNVFGIYVGKGKKEITWELRGNFFFGYIHML